jgi:hypothetical protein
LSAPFASPGAFEEVEGLKAGCWLIAHHLILQQKDIGTPKNGATCIARRMQALSTSVNPKIDVYCL